jgi:hypothetical protein
VSFKWHADVEYSWRGYSCTYHADYQERPTLIPPTVHILCKLESWPSRNALCEGNEIAPARSSPPVAQRLREAAKERRESYSQDKSDRYQHSECPRRTNISSKSDADSARFPGTKNDDHNEGDDVVSMLTKLLYAPMCACTEGCVESEQASRQDPVCKDDYGCRQRQSENAKKCDSNIAQRSEILRLSQCAARTHPIEHSQLIVARAEDDRVISGRRFALRSWDQKAGGQRARGD